MQNQRQKEIMKYLSETKFARADQLAEIFQVSLETIRRDLTELERDSSVRRIRGGAVYSSLRAKELEFSKKMECNQKEKLDIARMAMGYISDGDAIAMNNGITTLALAKCLQQNRKRLTVITNSPDIALILSESETNQVFLTSGYLRKHNKSLVGSLCSECIAQFNVDKTILSVDGVSIADGVMEYNTEESAVLRRMLEIGHTKILLCELSKFNEVAFNKICNVDEIDYIMTDWNMPFKELTKWKEKGVNIVSTSDQKMIV